MDLHTEFVTHLLVMVSTHPVDCLRTMIQLVRKFDPLGTALIAFLPFKSYNWLKKGAKDLIQKQPHFLETQTTT